MYGIYKYRKNYFVQSSRNTRRRKQLIALNDNHEVLNIIAKNLNLKIPVVQLTLNKDTDNNDTNRHIFASDTSDKSECVIKMTNSFRTLPIKYTKDINNKEMTTQNGTDKNVTIAMQNKFTSNVILPECNPCVQLNKDTISGNVDTHIISHNTINESECFFDTTNSLQQTFPININDVTVEELKTQNDKLDRNVSIDTKELQNKFASNVILPECNLYKNILNQSETNIDNNVIADCNIDDIITFSFEELNNLDISPNNILNCCNEDENNVVNNYLECYNNNNDVAANKDDNRDKTNNVIDSNNNNDMDAIRNNANKDNRDKINNNGIDTIELIQDTNNNQMPNVDNFDYNSDYSDDTDKDPDYCYNADSENSSIKNDTKQTTPTESRNSTENTSLETSLNVSGQKTCDNTNLRVEHSKPRGINKQNFCYYCKKMQSKISRHLERVHKNEKDVQKFTALPKGNKERQKIIALLRRKGNYLFNTDPTYNKEELIVCRRPTESRKKTARDFTCCAGCKGFFTKNNIRHHFKECTKKTIGRSIKILGRKVEGRIYECANSILRNIVFPVLREDDIIRLIRYDELLIIYGNKLCLKYKHQHQQDMIRSRLRLLGRFLQAIKKINKNVTDFYSIYHPSIYDSCITAVNQVAGFNTSTKVYAAPSVASRIGTLIKQIGSLGIAECIKRSKLEEKMNIENFLKLLQEDFSVSVNKTVEESILRAKRYQLQDLPSLEDIKLLHNFLQTNRRLAFQRLNDLFTYDNWRQLAQFTLISVQVFNRRRAGEIERISVDDYKHQEGINERTNPDLYESLSPEAQKIANKYVRFLIRGKLGRSVPVILDCEMKSCIDLLLHYRKEAKIPEGNPYIFALSGYDKRRFKYIRACDLLRTYSLECGASMPLRLRGTKLRKHIATRCITLNLSDPDVTELANYLGHNKSIHMQHYRQSIPQYEIVKMSRLLKIAQGEDVEQSDIQQEDNLQINTNENFTINETSQIDNNENSDINSVNSDTNSVCDMRNTKKRRSTSPYGSTKRIRWTQEECNTIITAFKQEITQRRLPSGKQMVEIKMKNKCLNCRSIPQIRSWIHNQISKKSKSHINGP